MAQSKGWSVTMSRKMAAYPGTEERANLMADIEDMEQLLHDVRDDIARVQAAADADDWVKRELLRRMEPDAEDVEQWIWALKNMLVNGGMLPDHPEYRPIAPPPRRTTESWRGGSGLLPWYMEEVHRRRRQKAKP